MTKHIKIWALLLCLFVVFTALVACKNDDETETPTTDAPTEAPTDAPTEEPTDVPTAPPTTEPPVEVPTECTHTGGTAMCTAKAVCTNCGESYGELDPENHAGTATTWTKTEATHKETYDCCNATKVAEAAHTYVDGVCSVCEYACVHTGGTATCTDKAVCTACGESYGELNANNHVSTETTWTKTETTHKEIYNCCNGVKVAEAAHTYVDGVCSVCEYACVHTGGTATCTDKAVCTACGESYGDLDADNHKVEATWTTTALTHKKVYSCCDTVAVETEDHEWVNGICNECGYGCEHKGGEATCQAAAICTLCEHSYGEIDPDNHTGDAVWTKTATSHKQTYNCCNADAVAEEAHEWKDGVCYECVYVCKHTGGEATCTSRAICEICNKMYGKIDANNHSGDAVWSKTNTTHIKEYNCCGTDVIAEEPHEWEDGVCTECGWTCPHTVGVEATCTTQAICEWCGEYFGNTDPNNHKDVNYVAGENKWTSDATTHSRAWTCCGVVTVEAGTAHNWSNNEGVCAECEYVCAHTGGEATQTCTNKGVCTVCGVAYLNELGHEGGTATCKTLAVCERAGCGESYGELDPNNHEGTPTWTYTDTTHQAEYDGCGHTTSEATPHDWSNNDGTCATGCGYVCAHTDEETVWTKTETTHKQTYAICGSVIVAEEGHEWGGDNVCDECGYTCTHFGGAATCKDLAICDYCAMQYGTTVPENHANEAVWTKTETTHRHYYPCCGTDLIAEENHAGGTAYCNAQAVCSACGTSYGSTVATNHASSEFNITYVNETTHYYRYKCCNDVAKGENHSFNNEGICVCGYEDPAMLNAAFLNGANKTGAASSLNSENGFNYTKLSMSSSYPTIDLYNANKQYNRYMLIRYRGNGDGYGNNYDGYFTINGTKTISTKNTANWFNYNLDGQWHYLIVDLGTSSISSLTWTIFDAGTITAAKGNWLDVEYIKFFGSYADAKAFEVARHPLGNVAPGISENGSNGAVTAVNVPIDQIYYATNANGFASGSPVKVPYSGNHLTMDWNFVSANGGYKIIVTVGLSGTYSATDIGIQIGNNDIEWGVNLEPAAGTYWCLANVADRVSLNEVNTLRVYLRNNSTITDEPYLLLANYTIEIVE